MTNSNPNPSSIAARRAMYRSEIDTIAESYLRASHWLPFEAIALREAFTPEQLSQAEALIDALADAADREHRQVQIVQHFAASGAVVLRLLKLAGIAP